jgi:hypothetical protein
MTAIVSVLLLALSGAAAWSNAAARPLTLHPHYRIVAHDGQATDGPYTVLWTKRRGELGTMINEQTGRRAQVILPAGCANAPSMPVLGGSWLLADCSRGRVDLFSPAAGQWRAVTVAPACRNFRSTAGGCVPIDVGTDWIEYDKQSDRLGDRFIFQNIASGAVRRDPRNQRTVANLDSAALARHVCAPLRVPRHGTLTFDGHFAVADGPLGTFLECCGTPLHRRLPSNDIALAPGALIAIGKPTDALSGIFLPSLRRFSIVPPPGRPDMIGVDLSLRHIYVDALARSGTYNVWSAPAPRRSR